MTASAPTRESVTMRDLCSEEAEMGASPPPLLGVGLGFPTCEAERMNLGSSEDGPCGITIFWKHVGHSSCPPLLLESAVICWPQTGHANLNSLIGSLQTIP